MNSINLTRDYIKQLNDIEPYCFETDREEQWYNVGLKQGLDVADSDPISPWISVDEDLPCFHRELFDGINTKKVVTIDSNKHISLNYMIYKFTKWEWNRENTNILFWFPIPKLLKE